MASHSPAPAPPPRLLLCLLMLAVSLGAACVFASVFKDTPPYVEDPTLCGNPAPIDAASTSKPHAHAQHGKQKEKPPYFIGGVWSPRHGLAPMLDTAMLAIAGGERPIVCQSAIASGESLAVIDRSPIPFNPLQTDAKPNLVLSIDYTGGISSMEYPAAAALQKYITDEKARYNSILIVEPLPGPVRDPDEDWTYLNFDGDPKIGFLTPKRGASPDEVALALITEMGGVSVPSTGAPSLVEQLGSGDRLDAARARMRLIRLNPYEVIPELARWRTRAAEGEDRVRRLYEALMVRRGLGVHADALIAEAAGSENPALRALAARSIGDLAEVTTDPFGTLTPLAEDDDMAVRYEALAATLAMPGRRAAGIAQLVEPYEMSDPMRAAYQSILAELLTFGEPIAADSRANRLRRMAINDLLKEERSALVCMILLERTDLPDDQIDQVLAQLAQANGQGPLVALLNMLEAMNPRTLAKRDVLLERLVGWQANELVAQQPRLAEAVKSGLPSGLRTACAAAMLAANPDTQSIREAIPDEQIYAGLARIKNKDVLGRWAPSTQQAAAGTGQATAGGQLAALDALRHFSADQINETTVQRVKQMAFESDDTSLRFAAIRAINAFPASIRPDGIDELALTPLTITAVAGMKYDKEKLTVPAGRPVELTLVNPDTMEHNLVITLPGRAQEIGIAMSADPTAAASLGYVPNNSDAVLHHTRMLAPGESETLRFFAPAGVGLYEYVCTFPGHYTSMRGVLEVVAP